MGIGTEVRQLVAKIDQLFVVDSDCIKFGVRTVAVDLGFNVLYGFVVRSWLAFIIGVMICRIRLI
jgi:hypothetical protein